MAVIYKQTKIHLNLVGNLLLQILKTFHNRGQNREVILKRAFWTDFHLLKVYRQQNLDNSPSQPKQTVSIVWENFVFILDNRDWATYLLFESLDFMISLVRSHQKF